MRVWLLVAALLVAACGTGNAPPEDSPVEVLADEYLDAMLESPVFMPLYRRHADAAGFPDTSEAFARLGIEIDGRNVRLSSDAELAWLRRAITRTDPEAAWRRQQLSTD